MAVMGSSKRDRYSGRSDSGSEIDFHGGAVSSDTKKQRTENQYNNTSSSYSTSSYNNNYNSSTSKGNGKSSNSTSLTPIKKQFYEEHPTVANLSASEVAEFRTEQHIRILSQQDKCPNPVRNFNEINLPDYVGDFLKKVGFTAPSPIQAQGWPVALSGRDMIGIAETGSGKTMAFLLPAVIHINAQEYLARGETGPICLVLAPTRELAQQIEVEARKIGGSSQIRCTCLVGGTPKGPQMRDLKQGREIVIATPGRLLDLLDMQFGFSLNRVSYLCLDEADRMLDMGFERDLRRICSYIREDRQTLLWSATWPKEVQKLARDLCKEDPVHIHVGEGTVGELKANPRITQHVEVCQSGSDDMKLQRIQDILQKERTKGKEAHARGETASPVMKTVIFAMTKRGCDQLSRKLQSLGALAIHGDKTQYDRDWCLGEFKKEHSGYDILVATDVAARGLDVKNVKCVINYDFPLNIEDYVHRIGRTGRAGTFGVSYSFFVASDLKTAGRSARDLCGILRKAEQSVPAELEQLAHSAPKGGKGKGKGKGFGRSGSYGGNFKGSGKGNSWGKGHW